MNIVEIYTKTAGLLQKGHWADQNPCSVSMRTKYHSQLLHINLWVSKEHTCSRKGLRLSINLVEETPGAPGSSSRRSSHGAEQPSIVTISADRLQNIEARVETLSQMVRTLQAQSVAGSAGQRSTSHSTPDVSSASIQEPEPTSILTGHLSIQDNGSVRYVEPSFFATMCKEVAELDELLGSQARYLQQPAEPVLSESDEDERPGSESEEGGAPTQRREAATRPAPGRRTSTNDNLWIGGHGVSSAVPTVTRTVAQHPTFLEMLPSKAQCDILLENYVQGYHPIAPMVHIPTFKLRYAEFWRDKDDPAALSTASMSMVSLLIAICYAGSISCPVQTVFPSAGSSVPEEVSARLHKLGKKALRLANFPRIPILDTFMAYVILQQTISREEEPLVGNPRMKNASIGTDILQLDLHGICRAYVAGC